MNDAMNDAVQQDVNIQNILGGTKVVNKEPWVLITSPVTAYKLPVTGAYVDGIKGIDYKNFAVLLCDNSESDDMYVSLQPVEKVFEKNGKKFKVVMTPHRGYIRERLVEGRNLARDVVSKRQDLSEYNLSSEDEAKIRELQTIDFEYVLGLEQDVIPAPDVIDNLISCGKDAVTGIYFNTKATKDPATGAQQVSWIPMVWSWANPNVKEAEILVDTSIEFLMPSRLEQTAATGVGCIMMTADLIKNIHNIADYRSKYSVAVRQYIDQTPTATTTDIDAKLIELSKRLIDENKVNTRSGEREDIYENFEYKFKGEKHSVNIVTKSKTYGFRYDQQKFACDDMFFSLDLTRCGYTLWFDSHVWCKHLHQMWDTTSMGER